MNATKIFFDDLGGMLDAAMLFGGGLIHDEGRLAALVLSRSRAQWRPLAWMIATIEQHGVRMYLTAGAATIETKLVYKSRGNLLHGRTLRRWYAGGTRAAVPPGIVLDEATLAAWGVDALARGGAGAVRFRAPKMAASVAGDLVRQARALGWSMELDKSGQDWALVLGVKQRADFEAWLSERVPRLVWATDPVPCG